MVITHLNFAKGYRGGERQTQLLIEELALMGFKQKIVVRKKSELITRLANTRDLEIIEINKPYIFSLGVVRGSSILHAHETKALQFAYFCNLFLKIPYLVTRRVDNSLKTNFFNTRLYSHASECIGVSSVIKKEILRVSSNATTSAIADAYTNAILNKGKSEKIAHRFKDKFLVGHIGALDDKHKGQSFLISVAKRVEHSYPDLHFIFLGRGDDEVMLKEQAKGVCNITFEGFVDNVNDYINCFDLFVFPSRNEGLGSVLLDVMQFNIPIVASDVGGIPDIIENEFNGVLVPKCNADLLEKKIIELYEDKNKREYLSLNAKKNIVEFSPKKMALKYVSLYEKYIIV